jgi:hypothetical protein
LVLGLAKPAATPQDKGMRPVTIVLVVAAILVGFYAAYRMQTAHTDVKIDTEERVLIERARGHLTASEADAIRAGVRLVRERDSGALKPTTVGETDAYKVSTFYDKEGGRDLIIDGPQVSTAVADGPCILTSLEKWVRPGVTVAHCSRAGFESIVTVTDMAGHKYVVSLATPGAAPTTTAAATPQ